MNKRFEIATGLLAAIAFGLGYFSPVYPAALLVVALIVKFDVKVRKASADAFLFSFIISILKSVLSTLIGALVTMLRWIPVDVIHQIASYISRFQSSLNSIISFIFLLLMVVFAFMALGGKVNGIPVISKFTGKFLDGAED